MTFRRPDARRRATATLAVLTALLAALAFGRVTAASAAGGLDPSFGIAGVATAFPLSQVGGSVEIGVGEDGSALLASRGGVHLIRFAADGTVAPAFGGSEGLLLPSVLPVAEPRAEAPLFTAQATAVDGLGRTVLFGELVDPSHSYTAGYAGSIKSSLAMVVRLDPDGHLDPSFGEGKGYVSGTLGIRSHLPAGFPTIDLVAGTIDSRNRPVMLAAALDGSSGCYAHGGIGPKPVAVVRMTESGALDQSFGGGDGVSPIVGSGSFVRPTIEVDGDDRPVASVGRSGNYKGECGVGRFVYRIGADGRRIKGFGKDGFRSFTRLALAATEPSGALILARRHGTTLGVVRVGPRGGRDLRFGKHGVAAVHLPKIKHLEIAPTAVDGAGRILLVGYVGSPMPQTAPGGGRSSIVVGRLLPDGRLDRSFGRRGLLIDPIPNPTKISSVQAKLDPQGRLLVAASVTGAGGKEAGYLLARFLLG